MCSFFTHSRFLLENVIISIQIFFVVTLLDSHIHTGSFQASRNKNWTGVKKIYIFIRFSFIFLPFGSSTGKRKNKKDVATIFTLRINLINFSSLHFKIILSFYIFILFSLLYVLRKDFKLVEIKIPHPSHNYTEIFSLIYD